MNTPDTHTETIERTETVTETVTTAACPVCEQRVDVDELVSVELGAADDATGCCRYCAAALFGYEGEPDGADTTDTTTRNERLERRGARIIETARTAVGWVHPQTVIVGLIITAVTTIVATEVATEATAQMAANPITDAPAPPPFAGTVAAMIFPTIMLILLYHTFRICIEEIGGVAP